VAAQVHALSIPLWHCIQHGSRSLPMFALGQLLLRIVSRIEQLVRGMIVGAEAIDFSSLLGPSLQCEVVRDAKEPSLQIRPGAVLAQMLEQGHEHVLDEIFAVADRDAKRTHIAKKRISELVEQRKYFLLNLRAFGCVRGSDRDQSRELDRWPCGGSIHHEAHVHRVGYR
jgi:hypothetical protein